MATAHNAASLLIMTASLNALINNSLSMRMVKVKVKLTNALRTKRGRENGRDNGRTKNATEGRYRERELFTRGMQNESSCSKLKVKVRELLMR